LLYGEDPAAGPARVRDAVAAPFPPLRAAGEGVPSGPSRGLVRGDGVDFVASRIPDGERIVRNLSKATEMARAFEWGGAGSLKLFLAEIRRKVAGGGRRTRSPTSRRGRDAVRLSTIHGAKGLESRS